MEFSLQCAFVHNNFVALLLFKDRTDVPMSRKAIPIREECGLADLLEPVHHEGGGGVEDVLGGCAVPGGPALPQHRQVGTPPVQSHSRGAHALHSIRF
jgi:hypothetical protein